MSARTKTPAEELTAKETKRMGKKARRRAGALLGALVTMVALAAPASALGAPVLEVTTTHVPAEVPVGTHALYEVKVANTGDADTTGLHTFEFSVPAGLEVTGISDEVERDFGAFGLPPVWECDIAGDHQSVSCDGIDQAGELLGPLPIEPGKEACQEAFFGIIPSCRILVTVRVDSNAPLGSLTPSVEACSASATPNCDVAPADPLEVVPFEMKVDRFDGGVLQENGDPATQAGSHPHTAWTEFFVNSALGSNGTEHAVDEIKDGAVELPPGLSGNPQVAATCTQAQLANGDCPAESQVGKVVVWLNGSYGEPGEPSGGSFVSVHNMEVPFGLPALFAFNYLGKVTEVYATVRSGEDYGVTVTAKNAPQTLPIAGLTFTFWGVPADPAHDAERHVPGATQDVFGAPSNAEELPFISLPTSCVGPGPNNSLETRLKLTGWLGGEADSSFLSHDNTEPVPNPIGTVGCNAVEFAPTLEARPTTNVADAPSGLDFNLHVPQSEDPEGNATAHLKDTTITLPEGLVVNPSGANGLDGCSLSEFGFTDREGDVIHTTPDPASCPDASKLGTVQVDTPLLADPLKGSVHIADPYANPFNSLIAIYIAVDDPKTGLVVKLAGEVHADPNTGRLTTTVLSNPQQPFEDFRLHFFGGAGGSLRTPAVCGTYSTTSSLTPWSAPESGPPDTPSDTWAITQSPDGGACPTSQGARPNTPDLDAGSVSPIAAAHSPTVVNIRRPDGSQELSSVNLTLPPGLTGKLAGVQACPDSALAAAASKSGQQEKSSPSCPASTQIGTLDVAAGAGPAPYHAQGTAYLTGPYKGAPLGMAIITPATAGPFDLGTVVVRVALHVDPVTAQITATSDQIPSILQGIPLDVRSAQIRIDRPNFTLNGTSCDPLAFSGQMTSTLSQVAPLSERFQLGECGRLAFKPKLAIRLIGGTKRGAHPALRATLQMPPGGANIARASVALPKSEFLDQAHIGTVCTRVQFAADECPAASVYGSAVATSPLVDYAVSGPVYLRSSDNELPDLVMALKGPPSQPVEVNAVARIDSVKGGIRSTFETVPDLPLTQVVLSMAGGKKGLLQNSTNICKGKHRATAEFDGQNGKVADFKPLLRNGKCGPQKKRKGAKKKSKRRAAKRAAR